MEQSSSQALTALALLVAAIYCGFQVVRDRKREEYGWAAAAAAMGIAAATALFTMLATMPVETHAVKIDLPVAGH